jgi:lactate 2-monooxygenase
MEVSTTTNRTYPLHNTAPAFQNEIYKAGMIDNILPTVTTDPNKLEAQAKEFLPRRSYNYVAGGAGERATMDANRLAFRSWKVRHDLLL